MRLLAVFLLLIALASADNDGREDEEHAYRERHIPLDMRYLGLSKKQRKEAKKLIQRFRSEYGRYYRQKEANEKAVARLFLAREFDTDAFVRLDTRQRQEAAGIQAAFFSGMHQLLTPKQRKRFVKYMEEWEIE